MSSPTQKFHESNAETIENCGDAEVIGYMAGEYFGFSIHNICSSTMAAHCPPKLSITQQTHPVAEFGNLW